MEALQARDRLDTAAREAEDAAPAMLRARAGAKSRLNAGKILEKDGKTAAAARWYRETVEDFPDTPEAGEAAIRLKALKEGP